MSTDLIDTVLDEMTTVLAKVSRAEVAALTDRLAGAQRVFVSGEGRSGLMAKAFAMRLSHLGLRVYVVGETTTPPIAAGDTVIAVSGSGTTAGTVRVAEQAVGAGATVHAVTTDADSPLAQPADVVLTVPAATKYRRPGEATTVQPLSSLFDQATHVVLDVVCLDLSRQRDVDNDRARAAHANTE
ncbi:6-phospho-3-hexuloisomerase [Modestobacter sp. DSM 44400]|uniref:6-phospho-3-hexuloisomerase n=1 Tax=Modestobacter sp. DSM 44400 TaxID=1550230 RepID=UPI00089CD4AB|nr:6-phospho-3-hexuloisomerase [Modestobacter sp. DSM 44400]SDY11737.1 6-phospho-3-hexuloisomerase [Modestobacter sp. DSM 44400]